MRFIQLSPQLSRHTPLVGARQDANPALSHEVSRIPQSLYQRQQKRRNRHNNHHEENFTNSYALHNFAGVRSKKCFTSVFLPIPADQPRSYFQAKRLKRRLRCFLPIASKIPTHQMMPISDWSNGRRDVFLKWTALTESWSFVDSICKRKIMADAIWRFRPSMKR